MWAVFLHRQPQQHGDEITHDETEDLNGLQPWRLYSAQIKL